MSEAARHDAWQAGDSYDGYMGRWSRQIAPRFLDWLDAPDRLDWLEIGCGTGALSAAILGRCNPRSLLAIDPSEGFIATARRNVSDHRAEFRVADAQSLPVETASRDAIASALALNFVQDRDLALAEIRRAARPGAMIGFYVWDYPGGGLEFIHALWQAAIALDPTARTFPRTGGFRSAPRMGCVTSSPGPVWHPSSAPRSRYRRCSRISTIIGSRSPGARDRSRVTAPAFRPMLASGCETGCMTRCRAGMAARYR